MGKDQDEEMGMVGASPKKIKESREGTKQQSSADNGKDQLSQEEESKQKADQLGLAYVDLRNFKVSQPVIETIPQDISQEIRAVPYLQLGNKLRIATDQENKISEIKEKVEGLVDKDYQVQIVLASQESIDQIIGQSEEKDKDKKEKETDLSTPTKQEPAQESKEEEKKEENVKKLKLSESKKPATNLKELEKKLDQIPTTEMFNTVLESAVKNRASDVHITPQESGARLRFRIDGVLQDVSVLGRTDYEKIVQRIKYHAKIKLNVSEKPQDGRFELEIANKKIDIRVSSFPSIYGESMVMRLLEEEKEFYSLEDLGFAKSTLEKVKKASRKPHGMILNTGPTGSGKTTTLYAILEKLNSPEVKIITLEDPIEYHLSGVTQTQIDPDHDFPFKSGLKYALRQDPDIIMVGEIRDKETAATALHSSLTGHLMLSTFHTNNAASTFVRMLDMGIKPFLLVGSVNIVIAQRLLRNLCPDCKEEYKPSKEEVKTIKHILKKEKEDIPQKLYQRKGCKKCNGTGFKGRTAIAEVIVPNKKIERAILKQPTEREIEEIAQQEGMETIAQNGVRKVIDGTTSLKELLRVVAE